MPKTKVKLSKDEEVPELLRDLLITTLGAAGVKQSAIREIVKCDIVRVNRITRHIRKERKDAK